MVKRFRWGSALSLGFSALVFGVLVSAQQPAAPGDSQREQAISALMNLGYKRPDADRVVRKVSASVTSLEDIIRAALQQLSG